MVRVKKRYFVLRLERNSRIMNNNKNKKRAFFDCDALRMTDSNLAEVIRDRVQELHGDHGRACMTVGLRVIYLNCETSMAVVCCRHGPHRLLAATLPFITKVADEKVVLTTVYTGATVRHCYKRLEAFQRKELLSTLQELKGDPKCAKEAKVLQEKLSQMDTANS